MKRRAAAAMVATGGVLAGTAAVGASCLPDLPTGQSVPLTSTETCGDGVIDLDAGEQCDPGPGVGDAAVGCTPDCQIDCDGGRVWPGNNHCYELLSPGVSSLQAPSGSANALCLRNNGHVVTFASEEEFRAVAGFVDADLFWVGLSNDPSSSSGPGSSVYRPIGQSLPEPGWSPACSGCYAFTPDASVALPTFPRAAGDSGAGPGCIVASSNPQQSWQQFPCSVTNPQRPYLPLPGVVCEREPLGTLASPCEAGTCFDLVATHGSKRYVYNSKPVAADQAKAACLAEGGRLVVLQSRDEREQLWHELPHMNVNGFLGVWIGLSEVTISGGRRRPSITYWQWEDNSLADARPSEWAVGQPMLTGYSPTTSMRAFLWEEPADDNTLAHNDQSQTGPFPFVCEITADTLAAAKGRDASTD